MGCSDINYAGDNEGKILGTFPKVGCGSATILEQWRRRVVGSKNDMNKAVADGNSMWQTLEEDKWRREETDRWIKGLESDKEIRYMTDMAINIAEYYMTIRMRGTRTRRWVMRQ
eukprot:g33907.t1